MIIQTRLDPKKDYEYALELIKEGNKKEFFENFDEYELRALCYDLKMITHCQYTDFIRWLQIYKRIFDNKLTERARQRALMKKLMKKYKRLAAL